MVDVKQVTTEQAKQRLRRADRLRSSRDYRRVNRTGTRTAGPHFVVQTAPGFDPSRPGLGLVVSRRVGNAVARNRLKRHVREWFRRNRALCSDSEDLVVIARAGAAELDGASVARELSGLVMR